MKNQMIQKIFKNRASVSCLVFIATNLILNPTTLKSNKPGNNFIKKIEGRASHFKGPRGTTTKIIIHTDAEDRIFACDPVFKTFPCDSNKELNKIQGRTIILHYEEFREPHRLGWSGTAIQAYDTKNPEVKIFPEKTPKESALIGIDWAMTIMLCLALTSGIYAILSLLNPREISKESNYDQ